MIEVTPQGHLPDFTSLKRLAESRADAMCIVRGTGVGSMFDDENVAEDGDVITNRLVKDLTSERAGIIGEVVLSSHASICEIRCRSCVKAYFASGAPILIVPSSPYDLTQIEYALSIFGKHRVPNSSIIVAGVYAHLRVDAVDRIENLILRRGANLCIDVVGLERVVSRDLIADPLPSEEETARVFSCFASRGYESQIVLGHGTLYKTQTRMGGSDGASRLLSSFVRCLQQQKKVPTNNDHKKNVHHTQVPRLHRLNVSNRIINMCLVENPARILAFYKPPKPTMETFAMWTCAQCKNRFPEDHIQFSRMEWLYCSVECLQNHRKGMKDFQNWVDMNRSRRDEDNNRKSSGRSAAWGVKT